jgi:signal-transduction protein with cAMP-binding, CBS, and nucleotidyltransferase domain
MPLPTKLDVLQRVPMDAFATPQMATVLGELRLGPLTIVSESESLAGVAATMRDRQVSCVLLSEPPLRVVTEHDFTVAWAERREGGDEVADIATGHPYWAPASLSVAEAAAMMVTTGIRHLVVVDNAGTPIGVISMAELFGVLVRAQEPASLYASFAAVLFRAGH